MQYRNLTSLGRAYRAGDIDRSSYILQRRTLIDTFTSGTFEDDEDVTLASQTIELDEPETVISHTDELTGENSSDEQLVEHGHRSNWKWLAVILLLVAIIISCIIFL